MNYEELTKTQLIAQVVGLGILDKANAEKITKVGLIDVLDSKTKIKALTITESELEAMTKAEVVTYITEQGILDKANAEKSTKAGLIDILISTEDMIEAEQGEVSTQDEPEEIRDYTPDGIYITDDKFKLEPIDADGVTRYFRVITGFTAGPFSDAQTGYDEVESILNGEFNGIGDAEIVEFVLGEEGTPVEGPSDPDEGYVPEPGEGEIELPEAEAPSEGTPVEGPSDPDEGYVPEPGEEEEIIAEPGTPVDPVDPIIQLPDEEDQIELPIFEPDFKPMYIINGRKFRGYDLIQVNGEIRKALIGNVIKFKNILTSRFKTQYVSLIFLIQQQGKGIVVRENRNSRYYLVEVINEQLVFTRLK